MKRMSLSGIIGFAGVLLSILLVIFNWAQLPEMIPAHFNFAGESDVTAPKWTLIILPILCLGTNILFGLMIARPEIVKNYPYTITNDNKDAHYDVIRSMARWLQICVIWTFVYVEFVFINEAMKWIDLPGLTILIPILITIVGVFFLQSKGRKIRTG